jgi:fructose-bisphosphate aldolase class II
MPLVSMRQLLDEAAKGGYGVGAFNVNDMEQIQAIMAAARKPSRRSSSRPAAARVQFAEDLYLFKLIQAAAELNPEIPSPCTRITATALRPARAPSCSATPAS